MRSFGMCGLFVVALAACEHGQSPDDGGNGDGRMFVPCTPQSQSVAGTSLLSDQVETTLDFNSCFGVIGSSATLDAKFAGNPPSELAAVDFAVDSLRWRGIEPAFRTGQKSFSERVTSMRVGKL